MKLLVYSTSPNHDGLTAACAQAACDGARCAGAEVEKVCINDLDIGLCKACEQGWGTCRTEHRCQVQDDFQALHARTNQADAYVLVNPVYFGELSESAKAFFDRLRRCEATRGNDSALAGKPFIGVAAAGGSGNGTVSCLEQIRRLIGHLRADKWDLITVTQKTRAYKPAAVQRAAEQMAQFMQSQ